MYSLFIYLYVFAIKVAALFNGKAREWVNGRKNLLENMKVMQGENVIWLHSAWSASNADQVGTLI